NAPYRIYARMDELQHKQQTMNGYIERGSLTESMRLPHSSESAVFRAPFSFHFHYLWAPILALSSV
ncbi:hypothetical protein KI387_042376, partial [Taxus chinensis]